MTPLNVLETFHCTGLAINIAMASVFRCRQRFAGNRISRGPRNIFFLPFRRRTVSLFDVKGNEKKNPDDIELEIKEESLPARTALFDIRC